MKINFKNTTKYTKDAYDKFLTFHQKKYGMKYKIYTVVCIILLLFCAIINFNYGKFSIGILFIITTIIFGLYRFYNPIKKIEKESNSGKIKNENEFTFTFYDHYMHVSGKGINKKVRYWFLKKAYEEKEYIYLYIDKQYAFVLKKDGFSVGKYKDFMPFIKKKILFKI